MNIDRREYWLAHTNCPKCGDYKIAIEMRHRDEDRDNQPCRCPCGWSGVVNDLVPPKPLHFSKGQIDAAVGYLADRRKVIVRELEYLNMERLKSMVELFEALHEIIISRKDGVQDLFKQLPDSVLATMVNFAKLGMCYAVRMYPTLVAEQQVELK